MPRATGKALDRWLRSQGASVRRLTKAAIAIGLVGGFLIVGQAWLLARILDAVIVAGHGLEAVWPWLWGLLAVFVARALVGAAGEIVAFEAGARVVLDVRGRLQAHIAALGSGLGPAPAHRRRRHHHRRRRRDAAPLLRRLPAADGALHRHPARDPRLRRAGRLGRGPRHGALGTADPAVHDPHRQGHGGAEPEPVAQAGADERACLRRHRGADDAEALQCQPRRGRPSSPPSPTIIARAR